MSADRGAASARWPGLRVGVVAFLLGAVAFGCVELHEHPERWLAWVLANGLNLTMLTLASRARAREGSLFRVKLPLERQPTAA